MRILAKLLLDDKWYRWFLYGIVLLGGISFLLMFYLLWLGAFRGLLPTGIAIPARDFHIFYNAGVAFSRGESIYEAGFLYFPLDIFFFLPLSHLSFYPAFFVITLWNLLMALLTVALAVKILSYYHVKLPFVGKLLVFLAIIFFTPVTASLNSGNVNTLVLSFITMFYYFLSVKDKNLYAGLSLVVATLFKIFPAALLLFAAVQRRFKFILAFLLILALFCVISILLLGLPVHIDFVKSLADFQSAKAMGSNSAASSVIYNSLEFFDIQGTARNIINITWVFIRLAFVLLILAYLYPVFKKRGEAFANNEWSILSFSLFSVLMVTLPNHAWVYYTSYLVLPFILCIFCLKLSPLEKTLLALSVAFFSFNQHIATVFTLIGGVFHSLVYLVHPSVIGNLLFLAFVLLKMARLRRTSDNGPAMIS